MRNPFRKKKKETPKPDSVREPWNRKPGPPTPARKTIVGRKADVPFLDNRRPPAFSGSGYQCPECSYPLIAEASANAPCPNCGYTGDSAPSEPPAPSAKTTINLGGLHFGQTANERKISLINETEPDLSVTVELEDFREIELGRESLDPTNSAISEAHVRLREDNGRWNVTDISGTGSTFIQASDYQPLTEGDQVILGNRRFRFATESSSANTVILTDESTGQARHFSQAPIELNRTNIDPQERSISSQQHARIEQRQGQWMIIDRSSNRATFVQVRHELPLPDQTRLLLGSKVFRFEVG